MIKNKFAIFILLFISINFVCYSDISDQILNNIVGFEVKKVESNPLFKERVFITEEFNINLHPFAGTYYFHEGTDYARGLGTEIFSPYKGKVIEIQSSTHNGNVIIIQHSKRLKTEYRHLSSILVDSGEIEKGEKIAIMGSTGLATGPNLDFRIIIDDVYYNSELFFELTKIIEINNIEKIKKYLDVDRRIYEYINNKELFITNNPTLFIDDKVIYENNTINRLNNAIYNLTSVNFPNSNMLEGYIENNESELSYYFTKSSNALVNSKIKIGDSIDIILDLFGKPDDINYSIINNNDIETDHFNSVLKYNLHEISMPNDIGHYLNFIIENDLLFAIEIIMIKSE